MIAFDLDGTLIDSLPEIAGSLNAVREECGLPPHALPVVQRAIGRGARVLLERTMHDGFAAGHSLDALYEILMKEYRSRCTEPTLYPGAEAFLDWTSERHSLTILTNKPLEITQRTLEALGLADRFAAVICPENARAPKPDPAGLLGLLDERDVSPAEAILIGDSENDFAAGVAGDVFTIGMRGGYYHGGQPEPHRWVDGFEALLDLWQNWKSPASA